MKKRPEQIAPEQGDEAKLSIRLRTQHEKQDGNQSGHMDRLTRTDYSAWPEIPDVTEAE
jgi:hypothetical protein